MNTKCVTIALAAIVSFMCPVAAFGEPAADKPNIVVGDHWQFARTTTGLEAKSDTWSRTVTEAPGDDRLTVKMGSGTLEEYDGAMNFMPQGNPTFRRSLVLYPLAVGKEWPINRRFPNPGTAENGSAKVVAVEKITVPAGTFECFRVDADATTNNKANYSARRIWSRWYCPEVKWIAKEVVETRVTDRNSPAANGTTIETSELVKFTPGK